MLDSNLLFTGSYPTLIRQITKTSKLTTQLFHALHYILWHPKIIAMQKAILIDSFLTLQYQNRRVGIFKS